MKHNQQIVGLVEPNSSEARAIHVGQANYANIRKALVNNANRKSTLVTDDASLYRFAGNEFARHKRISHTKGHHVSPDGFTTNNVEIFGVFKRGFKTYSHCGEQHLQRYLTEFGFRYTHRKITDTERAEEALRGIEGKRLTYRRTDPPEVI